VSVQPPDEEADEEDPRWELVRQLLEYKKFKEAAAHLHDREAAREGAFPRVAATAAEMGERPLGEVSVFDLIGAFNKVLKRLEDKREDLREIFEENFTVADKIDLILKMTASAVALKFTELFTTAASRSEIVITFLALLELIRLKQLRCVQPDAFGEIEICRV
jgi:segregation and condensation protein A